ncbi:anti-phage protein KwaA [Pedobacter petrophilus]|uniref:anti-phage protein KwaA n=1 Tax=Pedobacter petrophilus TaxID=1908241 RepID=UPI001AE03AB5|nr:anti-phage protein KwaA [Pedobacter petrophilus]
MSLKIQLYIVSLWLLFFLLFINKVQIPYCFDKNCHFIGFTKLLITNIVPLIFLSLAIFGLIFYANFKYVIRRNRSLPDKVTRIENLNWEHLTFLVTYVIPFLSFNLNEDRNGLVFFIVLIIIGIIYIKTNMFYTNPTLALLGYHIYKLSTTNKENIIIISKDVIQENDSIQYQLLSDNIYMANKSINNGNTRA